MNSLITSELFQIIGVTLVSSMLGIFVKWVSRNDTHGGFKKEDLSIGLEMMITALIILITNGVNKLNILNDSTTSNEVKQIVKENLMTYPWIILIFIIGLWGNSTVIRKIGWEADNKLKIWWGIVFPNIIGIASLIFVFTQVRL